MVTSCLTNHVYSTSRKILLREDRADCFTCKRKIYILENVYSCHYCNTPEWSKYFKMASKHPNICKIISWFDTMILQEMSRNVKKITLDVRIRIVCGMINKDIFLTKDLKLELMELIWTKYKERERIHDNVIAKCIYNIPF